MAIERGFRAKLRYKSDEFLSGGAGRQLFFLFVLTIGIVVVFTAISLIVGAGPEAPEGESVSMGDRIWHYFGRILDAGTMADDAGGVNRLVSTGTTILGVIVAGLLISSLAGNFQERLDAIKRGGSPVMEEGHFLILGWSEKIYSVIDQISEAYATKHITVVVMADDDKLEMEGKLRDKVVHLKRVKLVVRSGSSMSLSDLSRVSFAQAQAIVVLVDDKDADTPDKADGRIIKTLLAIYNHTDGKIDKVRVTAEVMVPTSQEIALIASGGRAEVIKTNEIISKILLQTSRISGLSLVYDELLRFEGNEMHVKNFPVAGRKFGDLLLDFPNGLVVGTSKLTSVGHTLNPPADYVMQPDDGLLILAEDANVQFQQRSPIDLASVTIPDFQPEKPVEHLLILGWNAKIFPILEEYDNYVGEGSSVTLVNSIPLDERQALLTEKCPPPKKIAVHHLVGEFTNRKLMEHLQPQRYPTVMVLADSVGAASVEESDTRAIIALLLLRDFRQRAGIKAQEVCSEILDPKNRELAATTEIRDVVISNEMVSMVLAQITYEPRIRPVLEDLFQSDGSEIYIKDIGCYVPLGQPTTFENLVLAAKKRNEVAMGMQIYVEDAEKRYGMVLNPPAAQRTASFVPKKGDRLVVLAEDDG
ncbi:MAG: hypothetical protein ABI175_11235 [Polyangiales bacterium]